MTMRDPQIGSIYAGLDTDGLTDGAAFSAHQLRLLARSTNRLIARPEPVANLVADGSTDSGEDEAPDGKWLGYGELAWRLALPPCAYEKRPGTTALDLRIIATVTDGATIYAYLETLALGAPAGLTGAAAHVLAMVGTGAPAVYSLDGIPCDPGPSEVLGLWVRGEPGDEGDELTYGAPSSAQIGGMYYSELETVAPGTWTVDGAGPTWATGGHTAEVYDATNGHLIMEPRRVTSVPKADRLVFEPAADFETYRRSINQKFRIRALSRWRLFNVAVYTALRTR